MSVSPLSRSLRKSLLPVNPFVFSYPLGRGGWASTLFLFLLVFHWVINWKGVSMRKLLKRFAAAASAVVICGVTCVTSWFSVPVSAVGVFSPFNFYQLYQMLHGLLLGDGGGNSQTFGEWLEKNMTRTVGSGNSKQEFLITPGMKLSDMMDEASMRLMLGAACSDGGFAGVSKIKDLIDSWTEVYTSSDIGEIWESGSSSSGLGWVKSCNGIAYFGYSEMKENLTLLGVFNNSSKWMYPNVPGFGYYSFLLPNRQLNYVVYSISNSYYLGVFRDGVWQPCDSTANTLSFGKYNDGSGTLSSGDCIASLDSYKLVISKSVESKDFSKFSEFYPSWNDFQHVFSSFGVDLGKFNSKQSVFDFLNSGKPIDWKPGATGSDDFVGPVYSMPAAKQLITDTGTLSGLRLDVQTEDGTPDISAALDHAGVDSVDDLVSGVAAGTIPMSQVYEDMRVVPYVLTDVETGQVVTDLNVSATDAKTKAVALDKTLSIPKDVSAADAYQVTGKTWDPSLSKYKLPLFNFFPFCLPWDIYQVLSAFVADPVAPSITVPVGKFFSGKKSFDGSAAADITATIDLGDDKFSKWFVMLRALESAGIVIGLVLVSVKLIHGGR